MSDIVKRLRNPTDIWPWRQTLELANEAADQIERLRAYNEQLHERLRIVLLHVAELRAENARMREVLRTITIGGIGERNWSTYEMRAYAEDALRP